LYHKSYKYSAGIDYKFVESFENIGTFNTGNGSLKYKFNVSWQELIRYQHYANTTNFK